MPPKEKKRGRPSLGRPVPVVLSEDEREVALWMGDGVVSHGVRVALRAAKAIGVEEAKEAASQFDEAMAIRARHGKRGSK